MNKKYDYVGLVGRGQYAAYSYINGNDLNFSSKKKVFHFPNERYYEMMFLIARSIIEKAIVDKTNIVIYTVDNTVGITREFFKAFRKHKPFDYEAFANGCINPRTNNAGNKALEEKAIAAYLRTVACTFSLGVSVKIESAKEVDMLILNVPNGTSLQANDVLSFKNGEAKDGIKVYGWTDFTRAKAVVKVKLKSVNNTSVPVYYLYRYDHTAVGVGLAAKLAPHYAHDVYTAILKAIEMQEKGEEVELEALIEIVKAPDFPTGAEIINGEDVKNIYRTGSGPVTLRSKYRIEKDSIIYYEIPYKVTPKSIIQAIVDLNIADIKDVRDETSLQGLRIVVELKKGANSDWIINKLFKSTPLQANYSVNMTAIMENRPVQNLDLKTVILYYCNRLANVHYKSLTIQKEELDRKIFINNTMLKAIDYIEEIIHIVRTADDPVATMVTALNFSQEEAEYIYNIRLSSLSKASKEDLDHKKAEYDAESKRLYEILNDQAKFLQDMYTKVKSIRDSKLFKGDKRRTEILNIDTKNTDDMRLFVKNEPVVISYTNKGMIKATSPEEYKTVRRNSIGIKTKLRDDEFIMQSMAMDTHSDILLFTDTGKCYLLPAYKVPITGKNGAAKSINNYLTLDDDENIIAVAKAPDKPKDFTLVLATRMGFIKRLDLETLLKGRVSTVGNKVISLTDGDRLCGLCMCEAHSDVMLFTNLGRGLKFDIDDDTKPIRIMGKTARGVTAINVKDNELVVACAKLEKTGSVLFLSTRGYGKRLDVKSLKEGKRAQVPINYMAKINEVGEVIGAVMVMSDEDVLITTRQGQILRIDVNGLSITGRTAKGLKMINIKEDDDTVVALASLKKENNEEESCND